MADDAAEAADVALRAAFLSALGVEPDLHQRVRLQQELEWFTHPRARSAAARVEPVDVLIDFLAATRLGPRDSVAGGLGAEVTAWAERFVVSGDADADRSPRELMIGRVEELFGVPATALADQLERLLAHCVRAERRLDSVTLRHLYNEALDLCDVWTLALDDTLARDFEPLGSADEVYATEAAVVGMFDPADPVDIAERRVALAELVRQLTELIALDRAGLLAQPWRFDDPPSLGWPAVLAQAQYRLRQISTVGAPPGVEAGAGREGEPGGDRRHGEALHVLRALDGGAVLTQEAAEVAQQRMRRSLHQAMPWTTRLQLADLAWELRRRPELMTAYGLGPVEAAEQILTALPVVLDGLRSVGPGPGPDVLPLNGWELRELFPELCGLLAACHDYFDHGDLTEYWHSHSFGRLPELVVDAHLASRGGSGRSAAELAGELAAFGLLFPGDVAVDRALGVLGEQPREKDRRRGFFDDLTWHQWLRMAAAHVMWVAGRADRASGTTPDPALTRP